MRRACFSVKVFCEHTQYFQLYNAMKRNSTPFTGFQRAAVWCEADEVQGELAAEQLLLNYQ